MEPIIDIRFSELCTSIQSKEEEDVKKLAIVHSEIEPSINYSINNNIKNNNKTTNTPTRNNNSPAKNLKNNLQHLQISKKSKKKLKNLFLSFLICLNNNESDNDFDVGSDEIINEKSPTSNIELSTNTTTNTTTNTKNEQPIVAPSPAAIPQSPDYKIEHQQLTAKQPAHLPALLPPLSEANRFKKTLVIDLDETLVHSFFKPVSSPDIVLPIDLDNGKITFYIKKRPYLEQFFEYIADKFEIVIFTASISRYADQVLDIIDRHHIIHHRLFRESCIHHKGQYVKDLSRLGRDLSSTIIIDNSPGAYYFNPENAIAIGTWINDMSDHQLKDVIRLLDLLIHCNDVRPILDGTNKKK